MPRRVVDPAFIYQKCHAPLQEVEVLDLRDMRIEKVKGIAQCVHIKTLLLTGNHIRTLPEELIECRELWMIDLGKNMVCVSLHPLKQDCFFDWRLRLLTPLF